LQRLVDNLALPEELAPTRTFLLSGYLCNWILKVATANRAVALLKQKRGLVIAKTAMDITTTQSS
jgi:hypothetical protein